MVFIGVDLGQIDKMAPRRVKSAPGPIELNQHFGAKTDLLDLECTLVYLIFFECEGEGGWGEGGRSCEFAWEGEGGVERALIRG